MDQEPEEYEGGLNPLIVYPRTIFGVSFPAWFILIGLTAIILEAVFFTLPAEWALLAFVAAGLIYVDFWRRTSYDRWWVGRAAQAFLNWGSAGGGRPRHFRFFGG